MTTLRKPEPELLDEVPWDLLGPVCISCVKSRLSGVNVCLGGIDPMRALVDLPEAVQEEVDGDSDVRGDEVLVAPRRPDIEAVEDDDNGEEEEGGIREVWLEWRLEDKGIAVNALSLEGLVELDIRNADTAPGEETGDGCQVLEPGEDDVCTAGARHIRQEGD